MIHALALPFSLQGRVGGVEAAAFAISVFLGVFLGVELSSS